MRQFIDATRRAVEQGNWYGALAVALTLPDICGALESPTAGSRLRYVAWCDRYLVPRYTSEVGPLHHRHVFLQGEDCYALRCALLHEGSDDITNQRARKALDSFRFIEPRPGWTVHCNQVDQRLQLQVDVFAEDICIGVEEWLTATATVEGIVSRVEALMKIETLADGFRM